MSNFITIKSMLPNYDYFIMRGLLLKI